MIKTILNTLSQFQALVAPVFTVIVVVYFILLNISYTANSILAYKFLKKYTERLKSMVIEDLVNSEAAIPVTLLAPAYNEEASIVESIKSLMYLNYPEYEVIVINDGSKDNTLEKIKKAYNLEEAARAPTSNLETAEVNNIYQSQRYSNLWVIDKENGGKADALNAGIKYCHTPLFCAMDSDSLLEKDALIRIVKPFMENRETIAAGGMIRVANGCEIKSGKVKSIALPDNLLAQFQVMEYLRAFLSGRMGWEVIDSTLIISGAFGAFSREAVVKVGGYSSDTVGEDMELVLKLHHYYGKNDIPYDITFLPDPVAWTEVPEDLKSLRKQRERWQRGLYEGISRHKEMLFNKSFGNVGLIGMPYFYFLEMLGPFVELGGYLFFIISIIVGQISGFFAITFLTVAIIFGIVISITSLALEEITFKRYTKFSDLIKLFGLAVIENFGFRQLNTFWRFTGLISALRGKNKSWGEIIRKGFNENN